MDKNSFADKYYDVIVLFSLREKIDWEKARDDLYGEYLRLEKQEPKFTQLLLESGMFN